MMKKGLSLVVIAAVGLLIISCAAREEKAARADNQGQPITIAAGDFVPSMRQLGARRQGDL